MADGSLTQTLKSRFFSVKTPEMERIRKRFFDLMDSGVVAEIEITSLHEKNNGEKVTIPSDEICDLLAYSDNVVVLRLNKKAVFKNGELVSGRKNQTLAGAMSKGQIAYLFHGKIDLQFLDPIKGQKSMTVTPDDIDSYCPEASRVQLNSEGKIPVHLCYDGIRITNMGDLMDFAKHYPEQILTESELDILVANAFDNIMRNIASERKNTQGTRVPKP